MNKAIFFDRDGVICKEKNLFYQGHYITVPKDFEWEDEAREALQNFSSGDSLLILITNQAQINRGLLTVEKLHEINNPIYEELGRYGRNLDGFYFCPHRPEENCDCRKPKIGLVIKAKQDFDIDLNQSWFIGDTTSDIKAGKDSGCKTILVQTGYAGRDKSFDIVPDFIARNLMAAYRIIKNEK